MASASATFKQRELLNGTTLTITVTSGTMQRLSVRFGLWVMSVGARIAGVGHVSVGETDNIHEGEAWD